MSLKVTPLEVEVLLVGEDVQVVQLFDLVTKSVAFAQADQITHVLEKWLPHMTDEALATVSALQQRANECDWWMVDELAQSLHIEVIRI